MMRSDGTHPFVSAENVLYILRDRRNSILSFFGSFSRKSLRFRTVPGFDVLPKPVSPAVWPGFISEGGKG